MTKPNYKPTLLANQAGVVLIPIESQKPQFSLKWLNKRKLKAHPKWLLIPIGVCLIVVFKAVGALICAKLIILYALDKLTAPRFQISDLRGGSYGG